MQYKHVNPGLAPLLTAVSKLKPDPRNARKHDARSIEAIRASLAEHGQQKPLVALRDGTVIAGNGTLEAARALGWGSLAVVWFDDEAKARAFAVADNRAAELSGWNVDELLKQVADLGDPTALGFTPGEVSDLEDLLRNPFTTTGVDVDELKPHPRNYKKHPEDQLEHLAKSIEAHGFYRNVVVARDNTILAGHGVVEAARKMGRKRVPVIRLDLDPSEPRALKVLTSDNEISNLAETDSRALTELLKDIMGTDGLAGTGFDEMQLAGLAFVTRPASEMATMDAAAEWAGAGMPEYETGEYPIKLVVTFKTPEERDRFVAETGIRLDTAKSGGRTWSTRWPFTEREDLASVRFEVEK